MWAIDSHRGDGRTCAAHRISTRSSVLRLCSLLDPRRPLDFATADLVSAASAAGFAAVGVNVDRVDDAAVEAYTAAGVRCHELLALVVSDDESATMASAELLG